MRLDSAKPPAGVSPTGSGLELIKTAFKLLRADPAGMHGLVIYGQQSPLQDALRTALHRHFKPIQLPINAGYAELHGGLDTTATLAEGRLVHQPGLLQRSASCGLAISSAQRLPAYVSSVLCAAIDTKRNNASNNALACPKVILAIDDSLEQEPGIHASGLAERLALHICIPDISVFDVLPDSKALLNDPNRLIDFDSNAQPVETRAPASVILTDKILKELTCLALQLGITSMLPLLHTCRVARTLAALDNRDAVTEADALLAVQLSMAPHAMNPPQEQSEEQNEQPEQTEQQNEDQDNTDFQPPNTDPEREPDVQDSPEPPPEQQPGEAMHDRMIAAAQATLPQHLLASLAHSQAARSEVGRDKQSTVLSKSGRPIGVLRPKGSINGQRINIIDTLKVAVPMQGFRRAEKPAEKNGTANRIQLRREDLRVTRYRQSSRTTTVFVVDASGSSAMHRLAEAKGAVELLLAECYVRRDRVALITFRGTEATLDLPPTRSLTRAKRSLQNLPGGGGTPLAAGLQMAYRVLSSLSQDGEAPIGVFMTDAKANIALDGSASRALASSDAEHQSQLLKTTAARLLFVDTANRKGLQAQALAKHMGANYLALPRNGSQVLPNIISGYAQ